MTVLKDASNEPPASPDTTPLPTPSLQDSFQRFRSERARQRAQRTPVVRLREHAAQCRARDPVAYKSALRLKFIAQAQNYLGTPYAERYHKPGDALHGKPLYLDCCALVRQAICDLRADFGFDLGRWNQAYQFATLPQARTFDQLQPGDLMFVEGTYHTGRHRQQKLNIVHVEIFLGAQLGAGPESTLGSRNRWGCVEVHDSYKYESSFYTITNVFWRSLDDWLEGRCDPLLLKDSFTNHDPYGALEKRLGHRSVFGQAAADGDCCQAADVGDDADDNETPTHRRL